MKKLDQTNAYQIPLWGLFFIALMVLLTLAKALFLPILLALLLSLTFSPVVRMLRRRGLPETLSAAIIVLLGALFFTFAVLFLAEPFSRWIEGFPQQFLEVKKRLAVVFEKVELLQNATESVSQATSGKSAPQASSASSDGTDLIALAASNVFSVATTTLVAAVLTFFLLAKGRVFYSKVLERFSTLQDKKDVLATVYTIEFSISRYLFTITIINFLLGVCITIAMLILGMPNPYFWGIAAAILNFLPFIGALMGIIGSGVAAILVFDQLGTAFLIPITYGVITVIEGQLVTPSYIGKRLSINPVFVFLSLAVWSFMWGLAGALIAVPLLVIVFTISKHVEQLSWFAHLISDSESDI